MGGRGSTSASGRQAASDARFYEDQREGFRRIAEQAERGESVRSRYIARTARAAESLVGTERAASLLAEPGVSAVAREVAATGDGVVTARALSSIEQMMEPGEGNRPLGLSRQRWAEAKSNVADAMERLRSAGYTDEEVAAAVAYGRYMVRRR